VKLIQTAISEIPYEDAVEDQIKAQQKARADVQVAIANAIAAEQQTRTKIEQGKQAAAEAQWKQEAIKAQKVTEARQEKEVAETAAAREKEVAKLQKEAAEFTKQRDILLGQGESEKRRLILAADGALERKLETYQAVNAAYAKAIAEYRGNWVPQTVMGGAGQQVNGASALVDLLTAKTARDLSIDLGVKK